MIEELIKLLDDKFSNPNTLRLEALKILRAAKRCKARKKRGSHD